MPYNVNRKVVSVIILIMIGICLSACSTFLFKPAEEALESRIRGLMDAKVAERWGKVYEYYEPAYKENTSRDAFLSIQRKSTVLRYEIESIEISPGGNEATVKVKSDMSAMSFEFPGVVLTQKWIKQGWHWYLKVNNKPQKKF